ncbi:MAG: hypothetical protein V5A42_04395 [Halofilum sp. (in: g-proteobacteria)]
MTRTSTTAVIAAALLSFPLIAGAAEGDDRPGFNKADSDGDGRISVEEATEAGVPEAEAKREDIDNDGELTKADWKFVDMDGPDSEEGSSSES